MESVQPDQRHLASCYFRLPLRSIRVHSNRHGFCFSAPFCLLPFFCFGNCLSNSSLAKHNQQHSGMDCPRSIYLRIIDIKALSRFHAQIPLHILNGFDSPYCPKRTWMYAVHVHHAAYQRSRYLHVQQDRFLHALDIYRTFLLNQDQHHREGAHALLECLQQSL